jgi:predicted GNAT superfamily acetyltransferase
MKDLQIKAIATQGAATQTALRKLNNANAVETSFLTPQKWRSMIDSAFLTTSVGTSAALLITFDQDANYDSVNFRWFCERFDRFVYVDRIVVSEQYRGAGLAKMLYEDFFNRARKDRHEIVTCEINAIPPNPGSDAFHARMGFVEMGQAELTDRNKTVRYLAKRFE